MAFDLDLSVATPVKQRGIDSASDGSIHVDNRPSPSFLCMMVLVMTPLHNLKHSLEHSDRHYRSTLHHCCP
jgi:hypothetical protein